MCSCEHTVFFQQVILSEPVAVGEVVIFVADTQYTVLCDDAAVHNVDPFLAYLIPAGFGNHCTACIVIMPVIHVVSNHLAVTVKSVVCVTDLVRTFVACYETVSFNIIPIGTAFVPTFGGDGFHQRAVAVKLI